MARRRARVDANHAAVVAALRLRGWYVHDCSRLGGGFPDLVVARRGRIALIEVKDGTQPPSRQALTPSEIKAWDAFDAAGVRVLVVRSVDEALAL